MLKLELVVSNTAQDNIVPAYPISPNANFKNTEFSVDVKSRGSHLYEIMIQTPSHYLVWDHYQSSPNQNLETNFLTLFQSLCFPTYHHSR